MPDAAPLGPPRLEQVELQDVGTRLDLGYAYTEMARALLAAGDLAAAAEAGRRPSRPANGDWLLTGRALLVLGRIALAQRDPENALAVLRAGRDLPRRTRGGPVRPARRGASRRGLLELGRSEEAIVAFRRASDSAGATYNPLRPSKVSSNGEYCRPLRVPDRSAGCL